MSQRISGKDFHINLMGIMISIATINLTIEDGREVAKTRGVANGWVDGDVEASGDIELDSQNLNLLLEAAKTAGSFRGIEPFDAQFYAETTDKLQVDLFGCLLAADELINIDANGGEKTMHKLSYKVTSPDFVHLNGIPYLRPDEVENVIG